MLKFTGVNPIVTPWCGVHAALEQVTIDAVEPTFNAWESGNLYGLVKLTCFFHHRFEVLGESLCGFEITA